MAFNDIAIHDGCVAALKLLRHFVTGFYFRQVVNVLNLDLEPIILYILAPVATTASVRAFIYDYFFVNSGVILLRDGSSVARCHQDADQ